jgi:hypothetical protein
MNTFDICIHLLCDIIYFRESYMHVVYIANGVFPLYCMSSYGGCIHLLYKLIYYPNSYMHVVQAPTIKRRNYL